MKANGKYLRQSAQRSPRRIVEILAENQHVRIERIVSTGQSSPEGFWYDQEEHEWVVVLLGEAKLLFEGDDEPTHMKPGDYGVKNVQTDGNRQAMATAFVMA